jgi:hypothetical protein
MPGVFYAEVGLPPGIWVARAAGGKCFLLLHFCPAVAIFIEVSQSVTLNKIHMFNKTNLLSASLFLLVAILQMAF